MPARVLWVAVALAGVPRIGASQVPPPASSVKPPCVIAADDQYAYSPEQPVQVGGSPMYGAARQRRYLDLLHGPEGQPVQYKRIGQARGPDETILDAYEVTYTGLEKPVKLYLDWYHFSALKAPRGFTCSGPLALPLPPVNPFLESDDVRAVAIAQGAAHDVTPIPLTPEGSTPRGVIYDRFRLLLLAARAAAAKDRKLDPENLPQEMRQYGMVIVAYPLTCGERVVKPTAIDLVAPNGEVMPRERQQQATAGDIETWLHGTRTPEGSFAITLPLTAPRPVDTIRITYADSVCESESKEAALKLAFTPGRGVETPLPSLPAGATSSEPVWVQALVDLDGSLQRVSYAGGPKESFKAAAEIVARWRFEPTRVNGAPLPSGVLFSVRFSAPR